MINRKTFLNSLRVYDMGTDQSQVMNFWYEFDNNFNGSSIPSEVLNAYTGLFGSDFNRLFELLRSYGRNPKKDDLYRDALSQVREHIITLAQHQTKLFNTYFSDAEALEAAFELFGQGVLYDQRRPDNPVHQMDGRLARDLIGYPRWHAFIRAAAVTGEDPEFWLQIDRCLCLAFYIQSELQPDPMSNNNKTMDQTRLQQLRSFCFHLDFH